MIESKHAFAAKNLFQKTPGNIRNVGWGFFLFFS